MDASLVDTEALATPQRVEVWRGGHDRAEALFGPLPGLRLGDVVAYERGLPARYIPAPGRASVERTFVLLEVGVSFANPIWFTGAEADTWYVDLVSVEQSGDCYTFRDLYLDVFVPMDGRPYRQLDLDEFADALANGSLSLDAAVDGLRRWQRFLDRYLHADRWPRAGWTDFPPQAIRRVRELPAPFAPPVYVEE